MPVLTVHTNARAHTSWRVLNVPPINKANDEQHVHAPTHYMVRMPPMGATGTSSQEP